MQHRRIIKQGPVVLATREDGSMDPSAASSQGLFLADTRYLSTFQLWLNDEKPVLLGSTEEILYQASYLHTNPDLDELPGNSIGLLQRNQIADGAVRIEVTVANWALRDIEVTLCVEVGSDFFDSFEARGVKRMKRGQTRQPRWTDNSIELEYVGADTVSRVTRITSKPGMASCNGRRMQYKIKLGQNERTTVELAITLKQMAPEGVTLQPEPSIARVPRPSWFQNGAKISTSNAEIEAIVARSIDDLEVLLTEWSELWVPAAGLPRFSVPFGRDCLITGIETLLWNPQLAHDVLCFLARTQGKEENPWNYEQPGKIMHEMHTGELARLREVPFGLFYGSVDSTPLFLVLGGESLRWTGDMKLYRDLKPNFDAAWEWIEKYGDIDSSGYVQYQAHTPPKVASAALTVGLFNQGWKDSAHAVMYGDGTMVTAHPVALAEVQGYLFRALTVWAECYEAMPAEENMMERAIELRARAVRLKEQFNREFWMPEMNYFAMGLDGQHRQIDSITSNPGHCLWCRLIDDKHAQATVEKLMCPEMFTAWGIRTMSNSEKAYNPFSYHDGSVWPFENALIAAGMKKYGFVTETQQILNALVEASIYFEYRRWPEVYCGVGKSTGGVLARQPDASRPQAWSAGAIFLLLQTVLGIAPRPFSNRIDVTPALPNCLHEFIADDIAIAGAKINLRLVREGNGLLMEIRNNPDDLDIIVHPAVRNHHHLVGPQMPAVSR